MPALRLWKVLLAARFKPRLGPLDESVLHVRVWPNDLDLNRHLNNGRAMTLTDLGRWDFVVRSGLLPKAIKRGWGTAVARANVRFRRPANLFQRLTIRTRILCWDEKRIYMEHRIERGPDLVLRSLLETAIVGKGRAIPSRELMHVLGVDTESPPMPGEVKEWLAVVARESEKQKETTKKHLVPAP